MKRRGFTLLELLVVVAIVAALAALLLPVYSATKAAGSKAIGAHSLHVLAVAGTLYLNDNNHQFWAYSQYPVDGGTVWWFGWESNASRFSTPEGQRILDLTRGPLGPYAIAAGGVKTDPAFLAYHPRLKPKYQNGNYGYGYNTLLVGQNSLRFSHPGDVVMFATTTVHFRDGGLAMVVCLDGGMRELPMDPTTLDTRIPSAQIGRFAPVGSTKYLAEDAGQ